MLEKIFPKYNKSNNEFNDPTGDLSGEMKLLEELRETQNKIKELEATKPCIPSLSPNIEKDLNSCDLGELSFISALQTIQKEISIDEKPGFISSLIGDYEPWGSLAKFFQEITDICKDSKEKDNLLLTLHKREVDLKSRLGIK